MACQMKRRSFSRTTVDSGDLDHLFQFVFTITTWTLEKPPLEKLVAILRLSHFFDIESGTAYAVHYLSDHPVLTAPMRLFLALTYDVDPWVTIAFQDLMKKSILDITENDEQLLGRFVYRLLVRSHAEVAQHRSNLAFCAPVVIHVAHCASQYQRKRCVQFWEDAWFGRKETPGMVTALLDQGIPGAALYSVLDKFQVSGMFDDCRLLTLISLRDTDTKISSIKKEDVLIAEAIKKISCSM
ncbi:hypothetical protein DFH07DRAFT_1021358 [Mycena maculata]|uniref:Uncharacterized protein n=1 Tax=Mycena maculata TaxID=230809 RepID=A0AAD7JD80_9AGAR|nr:hypothetical protein DFH07DRAFT_1021358 [Mycena maculata]